MPDWTELRDLLVIALPALGVVTIFLLEGQFVKRAFPPLANVTFVPDVDADGGQGKASLPRRSRLYLLRALWAATGLGMCVAVVATAAVSARIVLLTLGWPGLLAIWGLAALAGLFAFITVLNPITNHLLITSGLYRAWPEVERYKDTMAAVGAFAVVTVAFSACSLLVPLVGAPPGPAALEALRALQNLVIATGVMLLAGVLHLNVLHRLPAATIRPEDERHLTRVSAGLTLYVGLAYSLEIAALYLAARFAIGLYLPAGAASSPGGFTVSSELLAVFGPAATGIAAGLFARVRLSRRGTGWQPPKAGRGDDIRLLTYNTALLYLPPRWQRKAGTPPYVEARFARLAAALEDSGADIVALQEVFGRKRKIALARALERRYPYVAWAPTLPWPPFDCGLMILSRLPLVEVAFEPFEAAPLEERLLVARGLLSATVEIEGVGALRLMTYHTAAGLDPESARMDRLRGRQIAQILRAADAAAEPLVVLAGDLNAGPAVDKADRSRPCWVSETNYRQVVEHVPFGGEAPGYVNLLDLDRRGRSDAELITWESEGPLTAAGVHSFQNPQRIDHIFVARRSLDRLSAVAVEHILGEPRVPVVAPDAPPGGAPLRVPVSDHLAVRAVLTIAAEEDEAAFAPAALRVEGA